MTLKAYLPCRNLPALAPAFYANKQIFPAFRFRKHSDKAGLTPGLLDLSERNSLQWNRLVGRLVPSAKRKISQEFAELEEERKVASVPIVQNLVWQSPLEIVKYPDPRLRAVNAKIACFDGQLKKLTAEMFEVMYTDDGVGLAAPQVGVNVRLMVFNPKGVKGEGEEIVLVNPEIVSRSGELRLFEEGCLSFPGILGDVERPLRVRVRAQDLLGRTFTVNLQGWRARIFQHEYDHLEGKLFHDRMAPRVLESVRPQLLALEEEFVRSNPGVGVQRLA